MKILVLILLLSFKLKKKDLRIFCKKFKPKRSMKSSCDYLNFITFDTIVLATCQGIKVWGTIHLRRRQNFTNFWPLPPYRRQFFSTIRWQIWQIFDPSPPKTCRRLKWMVPESNWFNIDDIRFVWPRNFLVHIYIRSLFNLFFFKFLSLTQLNKLL